MIFLSSLPISIGTTSSFSERLRKTGILHIDPRVAGGGFPVLTTVSWELSVASHPLGRNDGGIQLHRPINPAKSPRASSKSVARTVANPWLISTKNIFFCEMISPSSAMILRIGSLLCMAGRTVGSSTDHISNHCDILVSKRCENSIDTPGNTYLTFGKRSTNVRGRPAG